MRRVLLGLMLATMAAATILVGAALAQTEPEFRLGFKALADQIPDVVGRPVEDEHWDASGDLLQRTTTGLMVWRRSDRWTAFTDGHTTWILGPYGLQSRLNSEIYPWERVLPGPAPAPEPTAPPPGPALPTAAPPPPTPTPFPASAYSPDVKAMDDQSGGHGVSIKEFVQEVESEWAQVWGWRPRRPTTVYLYADGYRMASGMSEILGATLKWSDIEAIAGTGAVARGSDIRTGGWAILVNLNYRYSQEDWGATTRANILHEYAHLMLADLTGEAGPPWFREGFAQWCAYSKMGGTIAERGVVDYASLFKRRGALPTLTALEGEWASLLNAGGETAQAAYGAAYLAVKHLAGNVGGMPILQALQRTAAGEGFDSALQARTGYSIARLEAEYRNTIP